MMVVVLVMVVMMVVVAEKEEKVRKWWSGRWTVLSDNTIDGYLEAWGYLLP